MKVLLIFLTLCSISWCVESSVNKKLLSYIGQYEFRNENGVSVKKSYYVSPDTFVTWLDAFVMCKAFGMDLVELPSAAEANFFLNLCAQQKHHLKNDGYHVGASYIGAGINEFYWMTTEKRVNYPLRWAPGEPNAPGRERCLSIVNKAGDYKFNDISYYWGKYNFICQHITNK